MERHAGPNPPQLNGSLDVLAKEQSHRITDFLSGHAAFEDGKREHRGDYRRRRILSAGFVTRMKDMKLPKSVMFVELVGGASCVGVRKKSGWGVSRMTSELSVSKSRTVDDCSPGRGEMAQDGGLMGGTLVSWRNESLQRE